MADLPTEQSDTDASDAPTPPPVRDAIDAHEVSSLQRDPKDQDGKLDVALDETFPTSDAPSNTRPGAGSDPAPSSGFDAAAEAKIQDDRAHDHH